MAYVQILQLNTASTSASHGLNVCIVGAGFSGTGISRKVGANWSQIPNQRSWVEHGTSIQAVLSSSQKKSLLKMVARKKTNDCNFITLLLLLLLFFPFYKIGFMFLVTESPHSGQGTTSFPRASLIGHNCDDVSQSRRSAQIIIIRTQSSAFGLSKASLKN